MEREARSGTSTGGTPGRGTPGRGTSGGTSNRSGSITGKGAGKGVSGKGTAGKTKRHGRPQSGKQTPPKGGKGAGERSAKDHPKGWARSKRDGSALKGRGPSSPSQYKRDKGAPPAKGSYRDVTETAGPERLQKIISALGIASRRGAEEMITDGRVTVNGKVVTTLGTKADRGKDSIKVDGKLVTSRGGDDRVYILLNKPKGYITALTDPHQRPLVIDLLPRVKERVYPVGRLDYDTEGVLLLTNDGDLSNRLLHPRYKVPKVYLVKVRGVTNERTLDKLRRGVTLADGRTKPAEVKFIKKATETANNSWIEITLLEGRNRLVRRMCEAVGHPVNKLKRTAFADLTAGSLKVGSYRRLRLSEIKRLKGL